jgi:hypothetical protein
VRMLGEALHAERLEAAIKEAFLLVETMEIGERQAAILKLKGWALAGKLKPSEVEVVDSLICLCVAACIADDARWEPPSYASPRQGTIIRRG